MEIPEVRIDDEPKVNKIKEAIEMYWLLYLKDAFCGVLTFLGFGLYLLGGYLFTVSLPMGLIAVISGCALVAFGINW